MPTTTSTLLQQISESSSENRQDQRTDQHWWNHTTGESKGVARESGAHRYQTRAVTKEAAEKQRSAVGFSEIGALDEDDWTVYSEALQEQLIPAYTLRGLEAPALDPHIGKRNYGHDSEVGSRLYYLSARAHGFEPQRIDTWYEPTGDEVYQIAVEIADLQPRQAMGDMAGELLWVGLDTPELLMGRTKLGHKLSDIYHEGVIPFTDMPIGPNDPDKWREMRNEWAATPDTSELKAIFDALGIADPNRVLDVVKADGKTLLTVADNFIQHQDQLRRAREEAIGAEALKNLDRLPHQIARYNIGNISGVSDHVLSGAASFDEMVRRNRVTLASEVAPEDWNFRVMTPAMQKTNDLSRAYEALVKKHGRNWSEYRGVK